MLTLTAKQTKSRWSINDDNVTTTVSYYNILYKFYYKLFNLQVVKLELELFASKACKDLHVFSPLCEPQQLIKAQN